MFIDAHVHLCLDGINFQQSMKKYMKGNYSQIRNALREYKKRNIYAIRDGGYILDLSAIIRELAYEMGIIYKTPINSFYKEGYYGNFIGKPVVNINDFKSKSQQWIKKNPDHIKIILTGLVDFETYGTVGDTGFTFQELYYMVQWAKDKDLPVMVHANSSNAVNMAIKAGADTIEHGFYLSENELYLMADNDIIWVPTLAPLGNLIKYNNVKYKKQLTTIKKIINSQIEKIDMAQKIGVKIAIGSDSGASGVYHGKGFFDEIEHLKEAGVSKNELNKMIFSNGIECLKLKDNEIKYIIGKAEIM